MYEKVLLLINGEKSMDEKQQVMQQVVPILEPNIQKLTIRQTFSKEEFQEMCQEATHFSLIIIYGGDGTVHLAINELGKMDAPPPLAVLPGGTCNDFSRSISIPQNLKKAAQTIMSNKIRNVDLAYVNGRYYVNFAGVGLITEASENIDPQLKSSFGRLSYFVSAIQQFQQSQSQPFYLEVDGEEIEEEAEMVLVMNGFYVGTHQFPLPDISVQDGLLDVFVVKESNLQMIREWFSLNYIYDGNQESQIRHLQAKKVHVETSEPKDVDTDGEVYMQTPVDIHVIPVKLKMVVGEEF
ncbi:diacylglycerol/lipid kinase family protein [Aquisalibacillus elongatus]|uniref:YegS/Rv2252/BmrU family lipid kinase n=1 Tax=Aquisalibacillus elongatus TaxID=485577 RepID=A0A3N5CHN4_9BACI|nr:diacylglycerol kinase family protein [Aquisalibacillus elongatus]RPF57081.1 YegS/Rv2252/BmrU family lipid kinase [Aquisalibacillus elongatus]